MISSPLTFFTNSSEDTEKAGKKIAGLLKPGDVVCLTGDLGSGKTTLIKGIAQELSQIDPSEVTSPTFTYLHIYSGLQKIYHFDLYRLSSDEEFLKSGFHEFLYQNEICCIEWPDKLPPSLSFQKVSINIDYLSQEERKITLWRLNGS